MTVDVLFLAATVPQALVGDTRAGHNPLRADIREAARAGRRIREVAHIGGVGSKALLPQAELVALAKEAAAPIRMPPVATSMCRLTSRALSPSRY